jgi:hypothetical protein
MLDCPLTTDQFYAQVFRYRLEILFARQRYDLEVQALRRLKTRYHGRVPQALWEKQQRRTRGAHSRLAVRRIMLMLFLKDLLN